MSEMVLMFAMKLMFVKEIRETDAGADVYFDGGYVGRLPRESNDKYAECIDCAREGLKNSCPVSVTMAKPDRIVSIHPADSDTVRYLKDFDAGRLRVLFWRHAAVYYLGKDNPDLHRITAILQNSEKDHSLVWLSFQQDKLLVVDALPAEQGAKH